MANAKRQTDGLNIQIQKDALLKGLARARKIVERKAATPSQAAVLIETTGKDEITLSAYDTEIGVASRHPGEVEHKGAIAVSAHMLDDVVKRLPENVVQLQAMDRNRIYVRSGTAEGELAGTAPSEIVIPAIPSSMRFSPTDTAALLALINGTKDAICDDSTRENLLGALLERTKIGWRMVALDGRRLAMLERTIDETNSRAVEGRVFIGTKTLAVIREILMEDDGGAGELGFNATTVVFRRAGLDIVSRLHEDSFPDWSEVVPEDTKHSVALSRTAALLAVQRMQAIAMRADHKIVLHFGKGMLRFRAEAPDFGFITDVLQVDHKGADVTLAVDTASMRMALEALETDQVVFGVEDSLSPMMIQPLGNEDHSKWVVMPQRVEVSEEEAIRGENLDVIFEPLRDQFRAQNVKSDHMEEAAKLGREAARGARKEKGGPLEQGERQWPPAGFWKTAEEYARREIPEDERQHCRETFWAEATKPWPAGEPTREQLEQIEHIGTKAGKDMLKAMGGNRLTVKDRLGKAWPEPAYWKKLSEELGRTLTDAEIDACREAYYDACALEDTGDDEAEATTEKKPRLRAVKD
jgi:DNA polymerase-3 subunit beta